jgi:hypothetical protein
MTIEDPQLTEERVFYLLEKATCEAVDAAKRKLHKLEPVTEIEGGFGGLGQPTVVLALLHAAEAGVKAAALGASASVGKMFFEEFLAPRLRKLNLLPSKFHLANPKRSPRSASRAKSKRK